MGSLIARDKIEAKKKGTLAAVAWGGTAVLFLAGWPVTALAGAVGSGYLTWKWFVYRAKRGMRF